MYTGERLVPERFGIGERIVVEHLSRYSFASRVIRNALPHQGNHLRILDAPCGVGYGAALLAEQTQAHVTGVDNDQDTINHAKRSYCIIPNVEFHVVNLELDSPEEAYYDAVVCFEGIEHVHYQDRVARELCKAVRPGGLIFVSTPRRGGPGAGSEFHTQEFAPGELEFLFKPYVSSIEMYGQDLVVTDCKPDANARYYVLVGTR